MAIYLNLVKKQIWDDLQRVEAVPASDEDLLLAHTQSHVDKIRETIYDTRMNKGEKIEMGLHKNTSRFSKDTYENKHTAQAAYLAAGGTVEAVRALCQE